MPALTVSVDGRLVAEVSTDGFDVLTVRIGGSKIDDDVADLSVAGGSYPESGKSIYLTWVDSLPLHEGQVVALAFLASGTTSHAGKTIDEMYPDEPEPDDEAHKPLTEVFAELRAMPIRRERIAFRVSSSLGTVCSGETQPDDHGFGFDVIWNSKHPERALMSADTYTLDGLERQEHCKSLVRERMMLGDSVLFELLK